MWLSLTATTFIYVDEIIGAEERSLSCQRLPACLVCGCCLSAFLAVVTRVFARSCNRALESRPGL